MSPARANTANTIYLDDEPVIAGILLPILKRHHLIPTLLEAVEILFVRKWASQRRIEIGDEELQAAADTFRAAHALTDHSRMQQWRAERAMTVDDFELMLEDRMLRARYIEHLPADKLEEAVNKRLEGQNTVSLTQLAVPERGLCQELKSLLAEAHVPFATLASRYSTDPVERATCGSPLEVSPSTAPEWLPAEVFSATTGSVIGPVETPRGWELLRVDAVNPTMANSVIRAKAGLAMLREQVASRARIS